MTRCFIFCHGWGFDHHFWDNLHSYFSKNYCLYMDLGYFSEENLTIPQDESMEFIGIGHSLGLIKLTSLNINFKALIGLHGFTNFLGSDPTLRKKRERDWTVLKKNFNTLPTKTLKAFHKRSGISDAPYKFKSLNKNRLMNDLELLPLNFQLPSHTPLLIFGSKDDIIAPPNLILDNFASSLNVRIDLHEAGRHSLGNTYPGLIYEKIMRFLNDQK